MHLRAIIQVAIITFKEGLKYRILHGIFLAALLTMLFAISISGLFMSDIVKVLLDICLSSVSLGGLLVPFFITIKLYSEDIDNKTIYTLLSRQITRTSYVIGRFFGLALLTFSIMIVLTTGSLLTELVASFIYPAHFFSNYSLLAIIISFYTSFLGVLVLNSVVLLWCSISTTSFLPTLLTIATYIIGQSIEDISRFINSQQIDVPINPVIIYIVKISMFIFPNLEAFNTKHYAAHGIIIACNELFFLNIYAFSYITIIILITILAFKNRDL